MFQVLLIEDDKRIAEGIKDYFDSKGKNEIGLTVCHDGDKGMELIYENEYDLYLLDVMLPGSSGFDLCRAIRRKSHAPVIFITARGREEDILFGYEIGCDDYIVKPFMSSVLYAKVNTLLHRSKGMTVSTILKAGDIILDPVGLTVKVSGKEIDIPPKEYAILKMLMNNMGNVVERETLLTKIWGYDFEGNDRVVDNHVKNLRKYLGLSGKQIKTVVGRGYKITE